ncbi:hypothetical protein E2F46_05715 [Luteimonas aestuarii]|uniref:Uncharacterized protein n=1 Tax=Luteimonas aestuarii TaxID=453837 RepID=A0A4R5TY24_9GAMM|nr:hypothetical protein [Luteimonas aestuarii]TDK26095.1 hypothetical protein E2F46_05715 [Luteimonas aestuarii]
MRRPLRRLACLLPVLALAGCGYTWPEGDKHPELPDFETLAAQPGSSLVRLGDDSESIRDVFWREGMDEAYVLVAQHPHIHSHTSEDRVSIRIFGSGFEPVGEIPLPLPLRHHMYLESPDMRFLDTDGEIYLDTFRVSPATRRVQPVPCVLLTASPSPSHIPSRDDTDSPAQGDDDPSAYRCTPSNDAQAIARRIDRADSIGRIDGGDDDGHRFLLRTGQRRELLLFEAGAATPDTHQRLRQRLSDASQPVPRMPDASNVEDSAIVGNRSSGNHFVFGFHPVHMVYYRVDTGDGPLRFKLLHKPSFMAITARPTLDGRIALLYSPGNLKPHRLYVK